VIGIWSTASGGGASLDRKSKLGIADYLIRELARLG